MVAVVPVVAMPQVEMVAQVAEVVVVVTMVVMAALAEVAVGPLMEFLVKVGLEEVERAEEVMAVEVMEEVVRAGVVMGAAVTGTAAAAMVEVAHWAADRMTVSPPPGTCSGHSGGGGGWNAARVQATMLPRKVQGWAKETRRRSAAQKAA